jgi:hypothetical protein
VLDDEVGCQLDALFANGIHEMVNSAIVTALRRRDLAADGLALVVAHEHVDVAVERRREQQRLALRIDAVEEPSHLGQEPHVGHPIGLVDHDDVDVGEHEIATLDEVGHTAGTPDGDVHAATESLELRTEANSSVERGDTALAESEEGPQLGLDLGGQLPGRGQDEGAGMTGARPRHALGDG